MFRYILIIFILFSCSPQWHLKKAIKKGAELETVVKREVIYDTVWHEDHFTLIEKDTVFHETTLVKYVPKTRYEVRYKTKELRDSLRYDLKRFKDTLSYLEYIRTEDRKEALRNARINSFNWWELIPILVVIGILYIVGRFLTK